MSKIGDKIRKLKDEAKERAKKVRKKARKVAIVGTAVLTTAGAISCSNKTEEKQEIKKILVTKDTTLKEFSDLLRFEGFGGFSFSPCSRDVAPLYKKLRQSKSITLTNKDDEKFVIEFTDEGTNVEYFTTESSSSFMGEEITVTKKSKFSIKEVAEGDSIDGHPVLKHGKQGEPDSVLVKTEKEGERKTAKYVPMNSGDKLEYDTGVLKHKKKQVKYIGTDREVSDTTYAYNEEGRQAVVEKRIVTEKVEKQVIPEKKVRTLNYKAKPKGRQ